MMIGMEKRNGFGNSVEWFDLRKINNEWNYLGDKTNEYHIDRPCLWFDRYDKNILYIGGNNMTNGKYNQLGKIEYCGIREMKWKPFTVNKPLFKLFKIENKPKEFRSRSLLTSL